jgi:hypothetical protein
MGKNKEKIQEIERKLISLRISFDSIKEELKKYLKSTDDFLETEAIDKKRRYGKNEFKRSFLQEPNGKVSSFMRTFLYIQSMEFILTNNYKVLYIEISKLEKQLESLKANDNDDV